MSMLAGVAAADITPEPGLALQGHWNTGRSHAVLAPLEVRSIVFRNSERSVCLITLDIIGVSREVVGRIRTEVHRRTNIPANHIFIAASHTHCAPAVLPTLGMRPDPGFMQRIERQAIACAIDAAAKLHPVTIGVGSAASYFNVNRRPIPGQTQFSVNFAGVVDHRARILRIDGPGDKPLAILFHFSCHPTTKIGSEGFISPDYPGLARAHIESAMECKALFLPGCFGNIRPQINGTFASATKEQLEQIANGLGRAVVEAADWIATKPSDRLDAAEMELFLPFGPTKSVEELTRMTTETPRPVDVAVNAPWARNVISRINGNDLPAGEMSSMQKLQIGPVTLVTIPGEPVQEIGYSVERSLASRGLQHVWATGYSNDMLGYLVTERQKAMGGYEPNAYSFYDRPAPFKDEEHLIVETAERLVQT